MSLESELVGILGWASSFDVKSQQDLALSYAGNMLEKKDTRQFVRDSGGMLSVI